jgi:hypothetical protein
MMHTESSAAALSILGDNLDPTFPIILGVILIFLILLRNRFKKKD